MKQDGNVLLTTSPRPARVRTITRRLLPGVICALALVPGSGVRAADLPGAFGGHGYGTFANAVAGPIAATLGRSAYQPCPCQGTDGKTLSNEIDEVRAGRDNQIVLRAAVTLSTVMTEKTATTAEVTNTAKVTGLNLLGGLITAKAVKAVANVSATTTTMTSSSAGSTFLDLNIGGNAIGGSVSPNTVIDLAGIGTVTLEKVEHNGNFKRRGQLLVDMLTVDVLQPNALGLKVGTTIVVAEAVASYDRRPITAVVAGDAYAVEANAAIGPDLDNRIGKAAFVSMGCEGTNGKTRSNRIGRLTVEPAIAFGSGTTTAMSSVTGASPTVARTTAQVTGLSLLSGLVTASTITAVAQESLSGTTITTSTAGSGFGGLTVAGVPVSVTVPPNTVLPLPGIGSVTINEQIQPGGGSGSRLQVNGLHIVVSLANTLGLPVGAEIIVAHADASAAPF